MPIPFASDANTPRMMPRQWWPGDCGDARAVGLLHHDPDDAGQRDAHRDPLQQRQFVVDEHPGDDRGDRRRQREEQERQTRPEQQQRLEQADVAEEETEEARGPHQEPRAGVGVGRQPQPASHAAIRHHEHGGDDQPNEADGQGADPSAGRGPGQRRERPQQRGGQGEQLAGLQFAHRVVPSSSSTAAPTSARTSSDSPTSIACTPAASSRSASRAGADAAFGHQQAIGGNLPPQPKRVLQIDRRRCADCDCSRPAAGRRFAARAAGSPGRITRPAASFPTRQSHREARRATGRRDIRRSAAPHRRRPRGPRPPDTGR